MEPLSLLGELISIKQYQDDFGWSPEWNQEIEKWLEFVRTKDLRYYDLNKRRVQSEKQRDELLGEYMAAYFIEKRLGGIVTEFESDGCRNDFRFKDVYYDKWNVEVKSPSWRAEVSKMIDDKYFANMRKEIVIEDSSRWPSRVASLKCPKCEQVIRLDLPSQDDERLIETIKTTRCQNCRNSIWGSSESERARRKAERLSQPQFVNAEVTPISVQCAVEDAINNAVSQYDTNGYNLLLINLNMFSSGGVLLLSTLTGHSAVRDLLRKYDSRGLIDCICLLIVDLTMRGFEYRCQFIEINRKPYFKGKL